MTDLSFQVGIVDSPWKGIAPCPRCTDLALNSRLDLTCKCTLGRDLKQAMRKDLTPRYRFSNTASLIHIPLYSLQMMAKLTKPCNYCTTWMRNFNFATKGLRKCTSKLNYAVDSCSRMKGNSEGMLFNA